MQEVARQLLPVRPGSQSCSTSRHSTRQLVRLDGIQHEVLQAGVSVYREDAIGNLSILLTARAVLYFQRGYDVWEQVD
jgi:hypothetical protein